MNLQHSSRFLTLLLVASLTTGTSSLRSQQPNGGQAPGAAAAGTSGAGQRTGAPPTRRLIEETTKATATGPAADILAFEEKLDSAILAGDTAAVGKALAPDFVAIPDDHWTTGGKSKIVEDRAAYLKNVSAKAFLVRDLDHVRIEMHPDVNVGITFGRFVTLARIGGDGKLMSTWYERVYAQRNGEWQLLSERSVSGPVAVPAGIDPTEADNSNTYGVAPVWFLTDPAAPYVPKTADEKEIAAMDQKVGTAVVGGDVDYVRSVTTSDFTMVHGDPWIRGGRPILKDTQESMLSRVGKSYGVLDFDHIRVEMHGDVAITDGRYLAVTKGANPERAWFSVWFERVFVKKDGKWVYISHRTVHGPLYGPSREVVSKE